jgi:hypothetical protein
MKDSANRWILPQQLHCEGVHLPWVHNKLVAVYRHCGQAKRTATCLHAFCE